MFVKMTLAGLLDRHFHEVSQAVKRQTD
jgi:hypothetical protein